MLLGVSWFSIFLGEVIAAPIDPAPVPDEVIQKIVREPRSRQVNPLPEILRHHLDGTSALLKDIEKIDQEGGDPRRQESSHQTKRMLLQSKLHELNALRKEVKSQISERRAKLLSLGLNDKVRDWDNLLKQVEDRFDRMNRALEGVRTSRDRQQRRSALSRAKVEMRDLHEKVKGREAPPTADLQPTFRQEKIFPRPSESENAPPPQYISSLDFPENIYEDQYAFWGKVLLVANPPATPPDALTNCSYTAEDLLTNSEAGPEVQMTSEIQALAESLGYSPVKIYQYVSNNIKFEPYYGSLKGAMGTLVSGGGNATDQASLLIALLRASNIPARYVKGDIRLFDDRGLRWLGAKSYAAVFQILAQGRVPVSPLVGATSSPIGVQLTHVWVEACVPYSNYRGAAIDITGNRWIPLDPSFKDKIYQAGIATNVNFDYDGYLASRTHTLPHEKYQEQVEAQIKTVGPNFSNNTIQDVGYIGTQNPMNVDILPASLPYKVQSFKEWTQGGGSSETAKIPDNHRYKFNISPMNSNGSPISNTVTLSMPDVVLKRITLSFKPATSADQTEWDNTWDKDFLGAMPNINVVSVIKVEGVDQDAGIPTPVQLGSFNKLTLSITLADFSPGIPVNSVTYSNIRAGGYHALQGYAFQASDRLLKERATQLLNGVRTTPNDKDVTLGEFLHLSGLKYMRYFTDSSRIIGELDGGSGQSGNHIGLTSSDLKVQYLFDIPFAVFPGELLVDVPGGQSRNVDITSGDIVWKTFLLSGYTASAYEHYIWQENARLDAISTVRGIQFARENNIEVLTLTSANWGAGDQSCKLNNSCSNSGLNTNPTSPVNLNYDSGVISDIKTKYIDNGYTVTIPRRLIQYQNWTGHVYVVEKNDLANPTQPTGAAGFIINGGYNGGYTVGERINLTGGSAPIYNSDPIAPSSVSNNATTFTNSTTASNGINSSMTISGDPVNMVTGNMYHSERDIFIKGRGLPLVFERSYNSRSPVDGPLGFGWTHSFNHYLKFIENTGGFYKVSWTDGTGGEKFFQVPVSGSTIPTGSTFTNPPGVFVEFRRAANGTYTIREKNGLTYTFESLDGSVIGQKPKLLSIQDRNGNTLTLGYTNGLLSSVTDGLNRGLSFIYTGSRIYRVNFNGWVNQYEYDSVGNLITYKNTRALVSPPQPPVTYTYYNDSQLNHAMKSYTLPKGNGMTFEYYMNGKVFKHYNTLGETTTFTYNEFRRETVTVNERGFTRKFFFDDKGNPVKIVEENGAERTYAYDPANPMNRTTSRDPMGNITQYAYDANGNVTRVTAPSGSTVEFSYFNAFSQPGKIKDANGNYTLLKYDANGNMVERIALKNGIGASIDPTNYTPVSSEIVAWTILTHDSFGNPLTVKQVRDFATQVGPLQEYDYNDTVNNVVGLNAVKITRRGDKNGDGVISQDEFDTADLRYDSYGRVTTGLRGDWYPTQFSYDFYLDRVIKATDAVGQLRDYTYDANGNPTGETLSLMVNNAMERVDNTAAIFDFSDRKIMSISAGGGVSAFQYDAAGNVVKITNPDGYTLGFDYDPNNRVIKAYNELGHAVTRTLDLDGKPRSVTDPNGNTTQYEYYGPERDGRLKKQINPLNRATQFDYDANGNVTVVTDPLNRTTATTYDELNRPVRIVGPVFTDPTLGQIRPVTRYTYDNLGNLLTVSAGRTDSSGNSPNSDVVALQMSYAYDDFGRKIRETDPLGQSRTFVYDVHGNPVSITDAKQQVTTFTYGYGHQLLTRVQLPGGTLTRYIRNPLGQPVQIEHPSLVLTYDYDTFHRLSRVTDRRAGKTLEYTYSPGGLLNRMKDSEGGFTDYLYDPVGRLSGIWAPNGDRVSYVYDAGGRLTEKWFPNGVNTRYTYNSDNTLKQLVNRSQSNTIISQHDYTYDAVGNRLTHNEVVGTITTPYKYVYDELSRLIETRNNDTNALIEAVTYDVLGNRKTKTDGTNTVAYIYDAANQLTEIRQGSETGALLANLVYDPNGNLITKTEGTTTTNFSYDTLDQLAIVSKTNLTQAYLYDGQGRRIKKTSSTGGGGDYIYSGPDIVAEYVDDNWTIAQATYTHGPNMDDPIIRSASTTTQYYHQDGLGSVVAVSDPTGATTGLARYDAWGNTLSSTGAIPQYGYTGREPDETGLIYYRGRYYDPSIGRFIQKDPIRLNGGVNLYAYVNNNPINFTDPWGLTPINPMNTSFNNVTYYNNSTVISSGGMTSGNQSLNGTGSGQSSGRADNYGWTDPSGSIATPVAAPTQPAFIPGSGEITNVGSIKTSDGQTFPLAQQITVQFSTPQIKDGNVNPTVLQAFPNEDAKGGGTLSNNFRENNNLLTSGTAQNGVTTVTVTVPVQISTDEHSGRSQTVPTYNQITVPGVSNQNAAFIVTPTTPCKRTCNISAGYDPNTSK
jgi:RHS repeat-associated protein